MMTRDQIIDVACTGVDPRWRDVLYRTLMESPVWGNFLIIYDEGGGAFSAEWFEDKAGLVDGWMGKSPRMGDCPFFRFDMARAIGPMIDSIVERETT